MIVFVQASYWERRDQTLECIRRVHDYVDRIVIVAPDYPTDFFKDYPKVELYTVPWQDDFPAYRNEYLRRCDPGDWVCVADPDEWYGPELCKDLRRLTEEADQQKTYSLLVNSHDITMMPDGKLEESISNFFKNLIFKMAEGVRYKGVGSQQLVHETLIVPPSASVSLPRKYYYEHHKSWVEIKERGARNVWIAGGGNNVGDRNPRWRPLRRITDRLGLKSWPEVREYVRRGNVDPELKEWIISTKDLMGWDYTNETRDWFLWYKLIHSEELQGIESNPTVPEFGSPPEVMSYVEECYKKVLGRHADDRGKEHYTRLILAGHIRRQDLPQILMSSQEYAEKFPELAPKPTTPTEQVQIPVPINVQVGLSEDHFIRAMMRSDVWWKEIKPKFDFAKKWSEINEKLKVRQAMDNEVDEEAIKYFESHVPPSDFSHVLAFNLETAQALDKVGYMRVINASEVGDLHNLPFAEDYFDAIYCMDILEHSLAPFVAITEMNRTLKEGGRIMVNSTRKRRVLSSISPKHLEHLMEEAGFKKVDGKDGVFIYEKRRKE